MGPEHPAAICKAIHEVGTALDFIIVDGSEGGTGAAPVEYEDYIGMPLTQGSDIVKRLIQGADYVDSARAMVMALGRIQSVRCAENTCPVGVATQNPRLPRGLHVPIKAEHGYNYQQTTVQEDLRVMASMGVSSPSGLQPAMLRRNMSEGRRASYATLFEWLKDWQLADPHAFECGSYTMGHDVSRH